VADNTSQNNKPNKRKKKPIDAFRRRVPTLRTCDPCLDLRGAYPYVLLISFPRPAIFRQIEQAGFKALGEFIIVGAIILFAACDDPHRVGL